MTKHTINRKQGGFTLIELSIVIVIIGLLTAALLNLYASYSKQAQITVTNDNLKAAQDALEKYRSLKGYYPCPADPTDASGQATDCAVPANGGIKVAAGLGGREVRIGIMPVLDLGGENKLIQKAQSTDGWRTRLTYAVTTGLAVNPLTSPGGSSTGGIQIINAAGVSLVPDVNNPGGPGASHVVLSHGDNAKGGYTLNGVETGLCTADQKDFENCNGDAVFISDKRSLADGGEYTDDYLDYDTSKRVSLLGPCTLFWNMNRSDATSGGGGGGATSGNAAGMTYNPYVTGIAQVTATATGTNLYLGRQNRPVDFATMHQQLFSGAAGQGMIYNDRGVAVGTTQETFPVDTPEAMAKLFEFKAVDPRTEEVVCINTYKPAPSSGGNSSGGGEHNSGGGSGSSGNGGHGGNDGDGGPGGGDGNNGGGTGGGGEGGE